MTHVWSLETGVHHSVYQLVFMKLSTVWDLSINKWLNQQTALHPSPHLAVVLCFQSVGPPTLCRSCVPTRLFFCAVLIWRLWCFCAEVIPHVVLSEQLSLLAPLLLLLSWWGTFPPSHFLPQDPLFMTGCVYCRCVCLLCVHTSVF